MMEYGRTYEDLPESIMIERIETTYKYYDGMIKAMTKRINTMTDSLKKYHNLHRKRRVSQYPSNPIMSYESCNSPKKYCIEGNNWQ